MIHQRKPNQWSCAITALAMALNVPVKEIIAEAGHDGSEKVFPQLKEPMCRKGFHSQELVQIAWSHGYAMTPMELVPIIKSTTGVYCFPVWNHPDGKFFERFKKAIRKTEGIIEGRNGRCSHAMYYSFGQLCDPDDKHVYEFSREECEARGFYINRLWVFSRHDWI
jgi:hypothetical protein